jgi:hypothetical protein
MIVLKDASHIASLEKPEEFARILIETQSMARPAACGGIGNAHLDV